MSDLFGNNFIGFPTRRLILRQNDGTCHDNFVQQEKKPATSVNDDGDDDNNIIAYKPKRRRTLELSDSEDETETLKVVGDVEHIDSRGIKGQAICVLHVMGNIEICFYK